MAVTTTVANSNFIPYSGGTFTDNVAISKSSIGGNTTFTVTNPDNTSTTSNARLTISSGGTAGGNPELIFDVPGGTGWSISNRNTNGDAFTITRGNDPAGGSTANRLEISSDSTVANATMFFSVGVNVFGLNQGAGTSTLLRRNITDGSIEIVGGNASGNGSGIKLYGSTHATKAGIFGVTTSTATNAAGALTLSNGPSGASGNPTGYMNIEVNGTTRVVPYW
jgi:hypothetical protein